MQETFAYGDFSVAVTAPPDALRWLVEFLEPSFTVGAPGRPRRCVALRWDPAAADAARRPLPPVVCAAFINDSHIIELPAWTSTGDATTAFAESWRTVIEVEHGAGRVTVSSPEQNLQARTCLMRAVREVAAGDVVRAGGVFLHAAAVAHHGGGVLIAGEKGAGKTTLLLHLLRGGAAYVSNDRLVALPACKSVRGMPTIVTLRAGTLAMHPGLAATVRERGYHHHQTVDEAAAAPLVARARDRIGITPAQLRAVLGAAAAAECAPAVVLFPRVTTEVDTWRLHPLGRDETAARLRRNWLAAGSPKRVSDLFHFADDAPLPDDAQREAVTRALAERVRGYDCALGPRAYADGSLASECLRMTRR